MIDFRNRLSVLGLVAVLAVAIMATACSPEPGPPAPPQTPRPLPARYLVKIRLGRPSMGSSQDDQRAPAKRLAEGLVPPTNRWFSGLVFGDKPQPVFPLPLSFGLTDSGFAFGQPVVTTTEKNISGGFRPDVTVDVGAANTQVSGYDTLTVTVDSLDGAGKVLGHTRIAEGSPFVSYTAAQSGQITSTLQFVKAGDAWTAKAGEVTYGLVVNGGQVSGGTVKLDKGGTATWFVVPQDGSVDKLAQFAAHPVTGSGLDYRLDGDHVQTTLTYETDGDTAFATMPHQQQGLASGTTCDLGSYPSIYGTMKLCSGSELSWTSPLSEPKASLDLGTISTAERKELTEQVTKDVQRCRRFLPTPTSAARRSTAPRCSTSWPPSSCRTARGRTQSQADRDARPVDRSARLRQAPGVLLRLRRAGTRAWSG